MERFIDSIELYVKEGIHPGDFLIAVLKNDLMGAIGRADLDALRNLKDICIFVYNKIPGSTWGSEEAVRRHLKSFVDKY